MINTYKEEIQALRKKEHEKAWNKIVNKISEGQIVSRYCKEY